MWLITTLIAAVAVTAIYIFTIEKKKYKLHWLSLALWGGSLMILVDHVVGYLEEGGEFLEYTTGGLITNATVLGIAMLIPIFAIWELILVVQKVQYKE